MNCSRTCHHASPIAPDAPPRPAPLMWVEPSTGDPGMLSCKFGLILGKSYAVCNYRTFSTETGPSELGCGLGFRFNENLNGAYTGL